MTSPSALQESTNRIGNIDKQIAQMEARITELKGTIKTSEAAQLNQRREIGRLRVDNESLQVGQYKEAVDKLEGKLKEAYDGIKEQIEALKHLAVQRHEFIQKLNDSSKSENDVVGKYNDLVKSIEKQQSK
jgi:flagellar biosynthesis chaperone FliJ